MFRSLVLSLWLVAGLAHAADEAAGKPPADVDKALRARIAEFFQYHVQGKFRQAEALVADDSKDFFYNSNKQRYLSFTIRSISYSQGFTRARAVVVCEQFVPFGLSGGPLKIPTPSDFKLVDGQWYWFVDQEQLRHTPIALARLGQNPPAAASKAEEMLRTVSAHVQADKQSVSLKPGSSDQVTITCDTPGALSISLFNDAAGVSVSLDWVDVKIGEKAVVTLKAAPTAQPGVISMRVQPTNLIIPVQIGNP